jgi:hypothetical protein
MLTFEWKNGRKMTAEEFEKAVEKMRKKAWQTIKTVL